MREAMINEAVNCIDCYREELLIYLIQRFGSLSFAQRVFAETQGRMANTHILDCVTNPHIYLISYALSVGLELMQGPAALDTCAAVTGGEPWHSQAATTLH